MPPTMSPTIVLTTISPQLLSVTISAFALAVSLAAFFVARRQSVTARQNLRLSLFDRRWKIYVAAHALLSEAAMGFVETAMLDPFQAALDDVRPSRFLLPQSAITVIDDVKKLVEVADAQMRECRIHRTEDNQAITKFQHARANLRPDIERLRGRVDSEFAQIMDFRMVK
jgi:hypothetical protein